VIIWVIVESHGYEGISALKAAFATKEEAEEWLNQNGRQFQYSIENVIYYSKENYQRGQEIKL
jgi:hypothetical protein